MEVCFERHFFPFTPLNEIEKCEEPKLPAAQSCIPDPLYCWPAQEAEDLRTSVGVPRAMSAPPPPRHGGRGVLDPGRGGREADKARGEYEMIPQSVGADGVGGDSPMAGSSGDGIKNGVKSTR